MRLAAERGGAHSIACGQLLTAAPTQRPDMDSFDEIEMKLMVSPHDLRRAETAVLAAYKVERSRIFAERAIYYDTADLAVRSHGGTLRVRRGPAGWEQV